MDPAEKTLEDEIRPVVDTENVTAKKDKALVPSAQAAIDDVAPTHTDAAEATTQDDAVQQERGSPQIAADEEIARRLQLEDTYDAQLFGDEAVVRVAEIARMMEQSQKRPRSRAVSDEKPNDGEDPPPRQRRAVGEQEEPGEDRPDVTEAGQSEGETASREKRIEEEEPGEIRRNDGASEQEERGE